jgi:hypothetical protein
MSLIFDRFPTREKAEEFVKDIHTEFGLDGQIFDDVATAMEHDIFPYELDPTIVHIDRPDMDDDNAFEIEKRVEERVTQFGGVFAGT